MHPSRDATRAFTLVELLVTIAIIGILAALLLTALSRSKAAARSASCKNHLHQMGMALQMYASENAGRYPYYAGAHDDSLHNSPGLSNSKFWWSKLTAYYPLNWTNADYHCPGYHGKTGGHELQKPGQTVSPPFGSYAYNALGVAILGFSKPFNLDLGLGYFAPTIKVIGSTNKFGRNPVPEQYIAAPSEMFSIGESRFVSPSVNGAEGGQDVARCGLLNWHGTNIWGPFNFRFDPARHGKTYNQLFCDGHILAMAPSTLFDPAKTAALWNRDHQPHPELWVP
jgi:prepilin-type N-terminal cleavage/methylation domain-containing protein/prepilin-type processing-associated H-X9-DG protein